MGNWHSSKKHNKIKDEEGAVQDDENEQSVAGAISQIEEDTAEDAGSPKKGKKEKVKKQKSKKKKKENEEEDDDSEGKKEKKRKKSKKKGKKDEEENELETNEDVEKEKKGKKSKKKDKKKEKKNKEENREEDGDEEKEDKKGKKSKKKDKKKDKKDKDKGKKGKKDTEVEPRENFEASIISNGANCLDVTNFKGDPSNLEEVVTVSVTVEPSKEDAMRGKENTRPVTVFEGPRPASPSGPGVSALMEKFGGRAAGGSRPISYPAPKVAGSSSPGQPHQAVTRKPFGYNRIEETPKRRTGGPESPTGNVSALKELFGGNKAGVSTPTSRQTNTPLTKATPGVRGSPTTSATPTTTSTTTPTRYGAGNRWSSKNNYRNLDESKSSDSESDASRTSTPTPNRTSTVTTTTTTTTGVSALRSRFKDNAEVKTGQESTNPEKRRKLEEERKRSEAAVQKENEKNRSPKKQWSPKKEAKVNDRDVSSAKDTSPRKRKNVMLNKIGGVAKAKTKQEPKEAKETVTMRTPIGSTNDEEAKEWARALITKRTSALISGVNNLPKTTSTPSRVQFEETVPKRTRREEKPKERPKTEYSFQNVQTPRPKSIADTKEIFSSPMSGNTSPAQSAKIIKNPTTKTQKLLQWCQIHTQGYDGVSVSNFHTSWADGLAFCALVHKFKPTAFNFNSLNGSNRRHNFDLAFQAAEEHFSVPQLLETDDMIEMGDKPDWKCVFTYVTALYAGLNKHAN